MTFKEQTYVVNPYMWKYVRDERVTRLEDLVDRIVEQHPKGTAFFDSLDEALCNEHWYAVELNRFFELKDPTLRIVVSGQWGRGFAKFVQQPSRWPYLKPLVLPGGLRHGELGPLDVDLTVQRFVFLDNSCYKGRTRNKIRTRILEAGGELVTSLVIYDGSKHHLLGIKGLWRWHGNRKG